MIACRAEDVWKAIGWNASQHDVAVRDGGGAVAAVTRRPGVGAGGGGTHLQAAVGEPQNRTTARRDRGDVDHRSLQPHPVDLGGEPPRDVAGGQADVRRRASHVEADQPSRAFGGAGGNHADHAAGGTRKDAVHAAKTLGVHEPAVALHEGDGRVAVRCAQAGAESLRVTQENGREVGVGHGRVAARHEAEQRCGSVRCDHFFETRCARNFRGADFVSRMPESVQERDGHGLDARRSRRHERAAQRRFVQRQQHLPLGVHALGNFDNVPVQRGRATDGAREDVGPILVSDQQRVAHALRGDQQRWRARALEQCVGGDGRAEPHRSHATAAGSAVPFEQQVDAAQCRIGRTVRVPRQDLAGVQRAIRRGADHVGERAAAIHGERPTDRFALCNVRQSQPAPVRRQRSMDHGSRKSHPGLQIFCQIGACSRGPAQPEPCQMLTVAPAGQSATRRMA